MEIKNDLMEQKNALIAALALILLSILGILFVQENSGRDEDMDFAGDMNWESSQNNVQQDKSAQGQVAKNAEKTGEDGAVQAIANPASVNCAEKGGVLFIKDNPAGQYGVCVFEDNRQCEEWAMFRGECPAGGLKITGYVTDAAAYCAITGGEYTIKEGKTAAVEQGDCKFKDGKICDAWDFWNGKCGRE